MTLKYPTFLPDWGLQPDTFKDFHGTAARLVGGLEVLACKGSAGIYGVEEKLIGLGVKVIYMGEPLTYMIKSDWKVISA